MASLELCPLSEHLEPAEIKSLITELEEADVDGVALDEDVDPVPIEQDFDDDVFIDFWDQLDANDVACDVYLPFDFEDIFEVGGRKFGSAHALTTVLANIKEDMFLEDSEEDDDSDAIEDLDDELDEFDEYGAEDDNFEADDENPIGVKDEQLRRVWRAVNKGARLATARGLSLFIHNS